MKTVMYDGYRFTRDDATGYYLSSRKIDGRQKRLHVYVWEKYNGTLPEGYAVHHIDEDKNNNDISNLMLLEKSEHSRLHGRTLTAEKREKMRQHMIENVHPYAVEWHKSEEGRAWHREHGKKVAESVEVREYTCENCGKKFYTKPFGLNKFCSNACKAAARRKSGVDNEVRTCPVCGEKFETNKYSKSVTCSRGCANRLRAARRI